MNSESIAGPTGGSSSTAASGKRDKRRQGIALRINYISERFEADRDIHYREMLHTLQSTLSSLHSGTNEEVLEQLADIEEKRDQELTRLNLWESYQIDRTEQEYQREIASANEEYTNLTLLVKERLMARLEAQRKRLREDKALLDIANDHMVFLSGSYGYSSANGENGSGNGRNGNANSNSANGYYSGGPVSNSSGIGYAIDRRHLRRRDHASTSAMEDVSGVSGGEGRGGYSSATRMEGRAGYGSARDSGTLSSSSKRRKVGSRANPSGDDMLPSDRDALEGILFSKDRDMATTGPGNGRQSKSYQAPAPLKNDDVQDDLNQLRLGASSLKRMRG